MITKEQVEHIAKLARLGLSEKEKEKFQKELSSILDFVEKLNEVDTSKVRPMSGGTDLANISRQDKIKPESKNQKLKIMKNAPVKKNGYFKIKRILEK